MCFYQPTNQPCKERWFIICSLENDSERRDVVMQDHLTSQNVNKQLTLKTDFQVEEQLRHTQERLRLKEEEVKQGRPRFTVTVR